jgi:hypothetical protein
MSQLKTGEATMARIVKWTVRLAAIDADGEALELSDLTPFCGSSPCQVIFYVPYLTI